MKRTYRVDANGRVEGEPERKGKTKRIMWTWVA